MMIAAPPPRRRTPSRFTRQVTLSGPKRPGSLTRWMLPPAPGTIAPHDLGLHLDGRRAEDPHRRAPVARLVGGAGRARARRRGDRRRRRQRPLAAAPQAAAAPPRRSCRAGATAAAARTRPGSALR